MSRWAIPLYRLRLGWLVGSGFVVLVHRGRNTGTLRRTCLMAMRYDRRTGEVAVVAGSRRADWYKNIRASSPVEVMIGARRFVPEQRFLSTEETLGLLEWGRVHHPFRSRIQALFFHWPWPGSPEELRQLAGSLAGVAFLPAPVRVGTAATTDTAGDRLGRGPEPVGGGKDVAA